MDWTLDSIIMDSINYLDNFDWTTRGMDWTGLGLMKMVLIKKLYTLSETESSIHNFKLVTFAICIRLF